VVHLFSTLHASSQRVKSELGAARACPVFFGPKSGAAGGGGGCPFKGATCRCDPHPRPCRSARRHAREAHAYTRARAETRLTQMCVCFFPVCACALARRAVVPRQHMPDGTMLPPL
jgi:hypothetical protein